MRASAPPAPPRGGATLLRAVAFSLAVFSHALAPRRAVGRGARGRGRVPRVHRRRALRHAAPVVRRRVRPERDRERRFAAFRGASAFQPIRDDALACIARPRRGRPPPAARRRSRGCLVALVFTRCRDAPVVACVLATLAFAAIGFADDRGKLASGRNDAGLSPVAKLAAQSAVASALFAFLSVAGDASGAFRVDTAVPLLGGVVLELGRGFWALAAFATVAESNAVNVADGLDGLAASASAIALCALGAVTLRLGRAELAAFAFSTAGAARGSSSSTATRPRASWATAGPGAGRRSGRGRGRGGGRGDVPALRRHGRLRRRDGVGARAGGVVQTDAEDERGEGGEAAPQDGAAASPPRAGGWRETAVVAACAIAGGVFAAAGLYVNAANARGGW